MRMGLLLAWTGVLATATATTSAQDQVFPVGATPINGRVTGSTATEVVIDSRGTERRIPVNELRRVIFREDPPELRRARDRVQTGDFAGALRDLKQVDVAAITRDEVKADLQFYLAFSSGRLALTEGGDKAAASAKMLDFARQHRDTYHFFDSAELLGDLATAAGRFEDATRYYQAIAAKAPWPEYVIRAQVLEAQAQLANQDYTTALQLFESAKNADVDTPEARRQRRFAVIGEAICLAETGSVTEARETLTRLIEDNDPQDAELFGRAYNALGRCHLKAEQPQEALFAYLHVDVLFYGDPETHAEALYNLSRLWKTVDRVDRAQAARNLLVDRYSGSRWSANLE